ncbi:hypothetical protein QVH36_07910 [Corynebacterium rouxii]
MDEELVNQFVSQLDFGLIDYEQVTQANEKMKGGEVGGRFAKGSVDANSSEEARSFVALDCEIFIPTAGKLIAQVDENANLRDS